LTIVENEHRAGNGSADLRGLDAADTKEERESDQSKIGKGLESLHISLPEISFWFEFPFWPYVNLLLTSLEKIPGLPSSFAS
jgi:hypothetical protein